MKTIFRYSEGCVKATLDNPNARLVIVGSRDYCQSASVQPNGAMDQESLAKWLSDAFAALPKRSGKSQKGLAAALGIPESAVTLLKKGGREFKYREVKICEQYLGLKAPSSFTESDSDGPRPNSDDSMSSVRPTDAPGLSVQGIIAPGVWREGGSFVSQPAVAIPPNQDPRLKGVDQYLLVYEDDPLKLVICARYFDIRKRPLEGDEVHVVRQRGDMQEHTIRKIVVKGRKVELHCVAPVKRSTRNVLAYPSDDQLETVSIEGLVVGTASYRRI